MKLTLIVKFTESEYVEFMGSIAGTGGGQEFVRHCQRLAGDQNNLGSRQPTGTRELTLHDEDVNKWFRYRDAYGSGGFQSRLGRAAQQEGMF